MVEKSKFSNFLASGFNFKETENYLLFRFQTLNYFMFIAVFFSALIGILGATGLMDIGDIQPISNLVYAVFNIILFFALRKNKQWFKKVAWAQVIASLSLFAVALITVLHDEFRIAWFYVSIYLAYMLLGERSGNFLTFVSIIIISLTHIFLDLQLSNTAIQTAIFSLIVFGLLSRVYTVQIKKYELQLQKKNNDLADSIKKLDVALDGANAASKTKSLFLANMSHEIRTPMNGMLSLVQVLQTTNLDEKQHDYLQSINRSGSVLIRLIDDLLDLSRVESGKLDINLQAFKLWEFIEDIMQQVEYLFDNRDVVFSVEVADDLPTYLISDDIRLKQVVVNLINNAVKFTEKGEVYLIINGVQSGEQYNLHIEVNDTGMGIPKDKIESIFQPFRQLSTRIYNKGVGLGLPISKKIIDALNGTIKVESTVGKGSSFVLDFIFRVAKEDDVKTDFVSNISLDPLKILLVEDDKVSRLAINSWLKDKGHQTVIAENGKIAIEYLAKNNVDAILMDVHMPEMDGVEATKIIKEKDLSSAPIIGMTASVMSDERKSYIKSGMDILVEKPVNFEKLMLIVKSKLNL